MDKDKKKFRSTKRRKPRGFSGKRPGELSATPAVTSTITSSVNASTSACSSANIENVSAKKLLNTSFEKLESKKGVITRTCARNLGIGSSSNTEIATGFKVQDASLLSECISDAAICSSCKRSSSKLQLFQRNDQRDGLSESLFLKCSFCNVETQLKTSNRFGGIRGGACEVNRRSVLASQPMGHAGLSKFCATMNLPPPITQRAYNQHLVEIEKHSTKHAEEVMQEAAGRLREKVCQERPDDVDFDGVAEVAVTVDGTWQKRGDSSKIGVIFVISVATGEILDYCVKSLFCHACKAHCNDDRNSDEHKKWKEEHQPKCEVNHHGSSEDMEATAAVEIFTRSISSRKLKYTTFVGDVNSTSYGRVKEALEEKFGSDYQIRKEECVGHVQKRLGTALRKYKKDKKGNKLSDGKSVGGKGWLTDKIIDQMQNYYGKAIRENKGSLAWMKQSIKAIQCHMIKNSKLSLHKQHCAKSKDTWCKYWKDKLEKTKTYKEDNRLPDVFMKELDPVFTRLSKDELLSRCLKGMTQNQNKAANGMLWSRCPKIKFCGARRVRIAVCETIGLFNTGAGSLAEVMGMCGITPGANTMKALRQQDKKRINSAAKKVSAKYRDQRRKQRAQRKAKADQNAYQAGAFSLSSKPDDINTQKKRKRSQKKPVKQSDVPINFVMPTFEVVGVSAKKRKL